MIDRRAIDEALMRRALELAHRGIGAVEPNPPVGAVVADDRGQVLGEGWHERYGGPHAEIHALAAAGDSARGAVLYVTLEPCCHFGKTPPCTRAILDAGIRRVVVGTGDPARHGAGRGIDELRSAGIEIDEGPLGDQCRQLIAPFARLTTTGLPWLHAKWAMTLDGKIATASGSSRWITNRLSREVVHRLRGRMDAILTGIGTVLADDPLLTARPPGPRTATRVVLDSLCRIPLDSQLVQTAADAPVLVVTSPRAPAAGIAAIRDSGVEVHVVPTTQEGTLNLETVLRELGRRSMTHVLIEAGGRLLGSVFDQGLVNEVHAFVAPVLVGGSGAPSPLAGIGVNDMANAVRIEQPEIMNLEGDVYVRGCIAPEANGAQPA